MSLWTRNGKLIISSSGKLIDCDHCPCDAWEAYPGVFSVRLIPVFRHCSYAFIVNSEPEDVTPMFRTLGVTTSIGINSQDLTKYYGGYYGDAAPLVCDPGVQPPSTWVADVASAITGANTQIKEADWTLSYEQGTNYIILDGTIHNDDMLYVSRPGTSVYQNNAGLALSPHAAPDLSGKDRELIAARIKVTLTVNTPGCVGSYTFELALPVADSDLKPDLVKVMKIMPWQFGELPGLGQVPCVDGEATQAGWTDVAYESIDPCMYPAFHSVGISAVCTGVQWSSQ